jgi:hypothetical protein
MYPDVLLGMFPVAQLIAWLADPREARVEVEVAVGIWVEETAPILHEVRQQPPEMGRGET